MAVTATDIYIRSGNSGAFTKVEYVQGGWITLPSASDMIALDPSRVAEGQIVYVQHEGTLHIGSFFEAFVTPGYGGFENSQSFAPFTWPGSGGGTGSADLSALNAFTASATARLNAIEQVTGSYATTSSNSFVGNQSVDGILILTTQSIEPSFISGGLYLDSNYNLHIGSI